MKETIIAVNLKFHFHTITQTRRFGCNIFAYTWSEETLIFSTCIDLTSVSKNKISPTVYTGVTDDNFFTNHFTPNPNLNLQGPYFLLLNLHYVTSRAYFLLEQHEILLHDKSQMSYSTFYVCTWNMKVWQQMSREMSCVESMFQHTTRRQVKKKGSVHIISSKFYCH